MDGVATTEELWTTFKDSLLAAVKKFIPNKTARPKTCQPWVTPSIRKLINRRDRTYRKMKKTGSEDLRTEVKNLRRTVQRQLRQSYWNYLNTVFTGEDTPDQAGKNKRFWSYIKHQKSSNTGVAPLKKDGHLTSDPKAQAELLNEQFQSVFGDGRQYAAEEFELKTEMADRGIPTIDDIKISEQGVKKLMESLSPYKAGSRRT